MASFTRTEKPGGTQLFTWTLTTADPTGDPVEIPGAADKTVQFVGGASWGGATAALQGSNDAATYSAVAGAASGSAITATTDANLACAVENPLLIRPKLTTEGTDAVVVCYLLARTT